jgi:nitrogen fixation protein FixH
MAMSDFTPAAVPFTGRRMLLIMVAFFATIITVNGTMLTFAVKTFGGLVVGNSYVASQNFNRDVAAARAQPIRGWDIGTEADTGGITVTIQDREQPVRGLGIEAVLRRPTHARQEHAVTLTEAAMGVYAGKVALEPGQWMLTLETEDGQVRSLPVTASAP